MRRLMTTPPPRARASAPARRARRPARRAASAAARRPPSARRPRSPCSTVKSASALARRAAIRRARDVDPLAVRVERADEVVEARRAARREETAMTAVWLSPIERRAALRSRLGLQGRRAEVGLRHDEDVRDLHDPGLQELEHVAGGGLDHDRHGIRRLGDVDLRLPDADRLDHHDVERRGERVGRGARRRREAAEAPAGGHRAHEHAARRRGRPRSARGRRAARRRSAATTDRRRARRRSGRAGASSGTSCESSDDLPAPGGPVMPTTCAGASRPRAAGETPREQRRDLVALLGRAVLDEVQHLRGRAQVAVRAGARRGRCRSRSTRPGR